jgi:hypothetical protein
MPTPRKLARISLAMDTILDTVIGSPVFWDSNEKNHFGKIRRPREMTSFFKQKFFATNILREGPSPAVHPRFRCFAGVVPAKRLDLKLWPELLNLRLPL